MAFTEDLDQFFDSTTGFAVVGTFKTGAGLELRSAKLIFTEARGAAQMFDNQVLAALPFAQCLTADLEDVDNTCTLTIGATTYRIVEHNDDGTGTSLLQLRT